MTRYRWQSRPGTGAQVTAGRAERQGRGSCSRLWSAWAAVSVGAGLHPHHGGGQRGGSQCGAGVQPHHGHGQCRAGVGTGWGSTPIMAAVSAGRGSIPISAAVSTRWGSIPVCSRWWSVRGKGPSPSAHGGGQRGARVHPAHGRGQHGAGVHPHLLTVAVSAGRRSIPICSRPGSMWAGVHPRPSPRASGSGL